MPKPSPPVAPSPRRRNLRSGCSRFPQITTRLPPETLAKLEALADASRCALWRALADCIEAYPDPDGGGAPLRDAA